MSQNLNVGINLGPGQINKLTEFQRRHNAFVEQNIEPGLTPIESVEDAARIILYLALDEKPAPADKWFPKYKCISCGTVSTNEFLEKCVCCGGKIPIHD